MCARTLLRLLLLGLLLAGCAPVQAAPSTPAAAEILTVQVTPSLRLLAPLLNACSTAPGSPGLLVFERPLAYMDDNTAGMRLMWGEPPQLNGYAVEIGRDRLVMIVHPDNPLSSLTASQVRGIYQGRLTAWGGLLQPECTTCSPDSLDNPLAGQEIHAWMYPAGEDAQRLFEQISGAKARTTAAGTAPDPEALRQAVAADRAAVGFLPERYSDESVRVVAVDDWDTAMLAAPLLAVTAAEPTGAAQTILECLQTRLNSAP